MEPGAVGGGLITGGWEYVWVVYGVSWAVLVFYTVVALVLRGRALSAESPEMESPS
jgi:heme exporter protein D